MNQPLMAGWAEESITPPNKIRLFGEFFERISEYVETQVTVTALAVESGDGQMVLCSCDLAGIGENLVLQVRAGLAGIPDLDPVNVIISATHTHNSHQYQTETATGGASLDVLKHFMPENIRYQETVSSDDAILSDKEALDFLVQRITTAVRSAWTSRKPASYANEFGRAAVGHCRRVVYSDGSAQMWGTTNTDRFVELEGGNDSGVELLYFFDESKNPTGVVANVACPSQVLEQRSFISSDYWGKLKILLRQKFGEGFHVLGLCSPAGDQCPRDMIRWVDPETPIRDPNIKQKNTVVRKADPSMFDIKGSWDIGRRIADEIISVYEGITHTRDSALLVHKVLSASLPVRRVPSAEYQEAKNAVRDFIKDNEGRNIDFSDTAAMHVHAGTIARYDYQKSHDSYTTEIHVIRFGDVAIATNPFELFLDYGNRMRARSRASQTFLVQLCCADGGYLPTKKAEQGGHYSAYISSGIAGHQAGAVLVEKTVEEIGKMWEENR